MTARGSSPLESCWNGDEPVAVFHDDSHWNLMTRTDVDNYRSLAKPLALVVLFPASWVLTAATNRMVGYLLRSAAPSTDWIATAAIPSFLIIAGLYALLGDRRVLSWPPFTTLTQRSVAGLAAIWLLLWLGGSAAAAITTGHWLIYARGWPLVLAFLVFGPLGEELLFRGLVFGYARATWPSSALTAVLVSTIAFNLHHIALNAAPHGFAMAQFLLTIPMGVVLALLRERTGSLWPGLLVHVATNLPSAI